jgi:hypothetical protein
MEMEANGDPESQRMIGQSYSQTMQIDPKKSRFPCCIVWTPLPIISWFIPFIGHIGICREDGVILDFAGPNFVCVDNFAFGAVSRYIQIDKDKECSSFPILSAFQGEDEYEQDQIPSPTLAWDDALRKSTQEFQHRSYNLLTCNCHSFVANNLNRLSFHSGGWNVVNLATLIFLKGQWVSTIYMLRAYLPFFTLLLLGLAFGGFTFFSYWVIFTFTLVGWYLLGTYFFKDLIQL